MNIAYRARHAMLCAANSVAEETGETSSPSYDGGNNGRDGLPKISMSERAFFSEHVHCSSASELETHEPIKHRAVIHSYAWHLLIMTSNSMNGRVKAENMVVPVSPP